VGYNLKATKKAFDPIPADRYTLKVESAEAAPYEKDGKTGERVEITYRIVGGSMDNRKVWDNIYLPMVAWKARAILDAGGSDMANAEDITADGIAEALIGLEVSAYIESSKIENSDNFRTNVKEYKPVHADESSFLR
jgi:hypothetical protein